jgi:hypothetical protein
MSERTYTAEEKMKAVERELGYRRRVYSRRVSEGKMSQQLADEQIALFEAIRSDYLRQLSSERLL